MIHYIYIYTYVYLFPEEYLVSSCFENKDNVIIPFVVLIVFCWVVVVCMFVHVHVCVCVCVCRFVGL